jgi:hypothetical protein
MKTPLICVALIALAGCGDQYRYPCQDPDNWNKPICQKPVCDVNRTCPEHIFKGSDPTKMLPPGAAVPDSLKTLTAAPAPAARPPAPPTPGPCR